MTDLHNAPIRHEFILPTSGHWCTQYYIVHYVHMPSLVYFAAV
jgi:hypothetical protein